MYYVHKAVCHDFRQMLLSIRGCLKTGLIRIQIPTVIVFFRESASQANMGFVEYVASGYDPCVNVVLLEDMAAVLGVAIAAGSMGLSLHFHSHIPDAVGSILIGGLLGSVASFMIYTNSGALLGRSIPEEKIRSINAQLEGDIMIRAIHDVKGMLFLC